MITLVELESISAVEHTNVYKISLKSVTWVTLAIIAIMTLLFPLTGIPTSFGNFTSDMYFHSIGIGIAALASLMVLKIFNLDKHEPPIDFPIHYRALIAVVISAVAAIIIGFSALNNALPDVGIALLVIALIFIADVGGALFFEMLELPRKLNGTFNKEGNYFSLMFPTSKADLASYKKTNVVYWLVLLAILSTLIAGLIGFLNLWVLFVGPSFLTPYINFLGLDASGYLDATLDPHSHMMALALMAGVVAIVAEQYHALDLESTKKTVARIGLWISLIGVVAMTLVLAYCAFGNFAPPTLLASGTANGIAGDDASMAIIGIGALIALIPLGLTKFGNTDKKSWTDPVRLVILGTWLVALILNILEGFYIEMNEDTFASTLSANDSIFSQLQPMYGIFVLTAIAIFLIAADYYSEVGTIRNIIGWLAGIGLVISAIGVSFWVFIDPSSGSIWSVIYSIGILIMVLSAIITAIVVFGASAIHMRKVVTEKPFKENISQYGAND